MQEVCDRLGIGYENNKIVYYCQHTKKECIGDKTGSAPDALFQDSLDLTLVMRCPLNSYRSKLSEAIEQVPQGDGQAAGGAGNP